MILVDTSVWVGYLRCEDRPAVARLVELLDRGTPVARLAIEHDIPLLHDDQDFDRIARVVPELRLA